MNAEWAQQQMKAYLEQQAKKARRREKTSRTYQKNRLLKPYTVVVQNRISLLVRGQYKPSEAAKKEIKELLSQKPKPEHSEWKYSFCFAPWVYWNNSDNQLWEAKKAPSAAGLFAEGEDEEEQITNFLRGVEKYEVEKEYRIYGRIVSTVVGFGALHASRARRMASFIPT